MAKKPATRKRRKRIGSGEMLDALLYKADHIFSVPETALISLFIRHMTWIDGDEPRSNKSWRKVMTYEDIVFGVRDWSDEYVPGMCQAYPEIVLETLQGLKDYGVFTEYREEAADGTPFEFLHLHPEHLMDLIEGSTGDHLCELCDNLVERVQENARV